MTPKEFNDLAEGYLWRRREREDLTAWAVSIIANASGNLKQPLKPADLLESLGREPDTAKKRDKATVAEEFRELKEEFNK